MKKVVWGPGKFTSDPAPGQYRSYAEYIAKAETFRVEQEKAQSYLVKALPAMLKLLEIRFSNAQPLRVMRPLKYQTSVLKSSMEDDLDKSFYNTSKAASQQDSFVNVVKTINPGTELMLKGLDPTMREFLFQDGLGKEHAISYDERNALLTQTDIFETVRELFESKGDK